MLHDITLQEGDIFLADSHEGLDRKYLLFFLQELKSKSTKPKNLFLCGDIFDILVPNEHLEKFYKEQIELINELALEINIIYLEGNHDFNLQIIFPKLLVVKREVQPIFVTFKEKKVAISHGDIFQKNSPYELYTKLIRAKSFLKVASFIDKLLCGYISNSILSYQNKKVICKKIDKFQAIIKDKIAKYKEQKVDVIIEGHYHQNSFFEVENIKYLNLSSFACSQSFFIVQSGIKNFSLLEVKTL